jgi:hypothetical protein
MSFTLHISSFSFDFRVTDGNHRVRFLGRITHGKLAYTVHELMFQNNLNPFASFNEYRLTTLSPGQCCTPHKELGILSGCPSLTGCTHVKLLRSRVDELMHVIEKLMVMNSTIGF